ncbi:MAG TPA: bifunctional riboflavin kinase/FAD synthetase [Euzebyales bacterium]|nr:bifunctional riboflavin kinase/FAD synthetase [Euzebyales bacterium]
MTSLQPSSGVAGDDPRGTQRGGVARLVSDLASVPRVPSVVSIGFFDGVHRGHQRIIGGALHHAARHDARSVVLTFDRHPLQIVRPEAVPPLLMTTARRARTLAETGVDLVVVLTFDERLRTLVPEAFVAQVLRSSLDARHLVVGHNFRFGHRAAGDVALLERIGAREGFGVDGVDLLAVGGEPVSSTRIRGALADGDVATAADLLGRPFVIDGTVVHGDHRGRALGFPTANLEVASGVVVPANGVYAGMAALGDGRQVPAAISIGSNPQFDGTAVRVEAYLLDIDEDHYGADLALDLRRRLRGQQRFATVDDLVAAMRDDVAAVRDLLGAAPAGGAPAPAPLAVRPPGAPSS